MFLFTLFAISNAVLCQLEFAIFGKGCTYSLFSESPFASVCLDSALEAADLCFISLVFKHWSLAARPGKAKVTSTIWLGSALTDPPLCLLTPAENLVQCQPAFLLCVH